GTLTLQSTSGQRQVNLDDFWISYGVTARRDDELAVSLTVPAPGAGQKSAFRRMTRTTEDLAKINAAVCLQMDGGKCTGARITMGCVGPTLIRLPKVEKMLEGADITPDLLQGISQAVASEITPIDDIRSSADYRLKVAGILVKRVINLALNEGNTP
ncbi:MAG: hypothetical protein JKY91_04690, partial [Emcibacter sp.]|nr:hypothetical protein [Emcibacter sp.]